VVKANFSKLLGVCLHEHTRILKEGLRYKPKLASMLSEVIQMVKKRNVANDVTWKCWTISINEPS